MPQDTVVATAIASSGTTWAQLKSGSIKTIMDNLVAANPAKANPTTTATVVATGGGASGGSLNTSGSSQNFYFSYSFVDAFGETLIGGRSTVTAVGNTNIPRVTLPSLPTNVNSINLYVTPANAAAGTEYLYATGITSTTFDCSYALPTDSLPNQPQVNDTGAAAHTATLYSFFDPNGDIHLMKLIQFCTSYLQGDPMDRREHFLRSVKNEGIARCWLQLFTEFRTLMVANQGTVSVVTNTALVHQQRKRVLP